MKSNINKSLLIAIIVVLVLALFGPGETSPAQAQAGNTITVNGVGTASGQPDIATVEFGYQVLNTDKAAAFGNANTVTGAITKALLEAGIAQTDIQLQGFTIVPEDRATAGVGPSGNFIFRVTSTLRVTLRDLSKIDAIIAAAVTNGANIVQNFAFGIDKVDSLEARARAEAVKNARARAEVLATSLGVKVGDAITISEAVQVSNVLPTGTGSRGAVVEAGELPGNVGQLIVTVQVQVTYTLRWQN
jgi:hypothetical protein